MSNTVSSSKFLHATGSSCYYLVIAERLNDVSAVMHFNDYKCIANATIFLSFPDDKTTDSVELTKDQITHLLSLDCPDAFIAYALTLCPCPPETAKPALVAVDGGILKCLHCNKFTNGYELDANNGYCNTCYAEPEQLPDQRYYSQSRFASLSETVPVCECGSTFYCDDLGSCYDCFFPSDDRGE